MTDDDSPLVPGPPVYRCVLSGLSEDISDENHIRAQVAEDSTYRSLYICID